jgi:hypothetical protein
MTNDQDLRVHLGLPSDPPPRRAEAKVQLDQSPGTPWHLRVRCMRSMRLLSRGKEGKAARGCLLGAEWLMIHVFDVVSPLFSYW